MGKTLTQSWCIPLTGMLAMSLVAPVCAQSTSVFRQSLSINPAEAVRLNIRMLRGDFQVLYSRDGQVSITTTAQTAGAQPDENLIKAAVSVERNGNELTIRQNENVSSPPALGIHVDLHLTIDVPYRTEVIAHVNRGTQTYSGIMGPVNATGGQCDLHASYLSKGLQARVDRGNFDLQVIGERVEASTGSGNISGTRLPSGIVAETGDGDITFAVVGPSTATVKSGGGRIDVSGAQGSLAGTTQNGDLHVKAVPLGDWSLHSVAGNIRIELPPHPKADLDLFTESGTVQIDRNDLTELAPDARQLAQRINGGGPRVEVHAATGKILIR